MGAGPPRISADLARRLDRLSVAAHRFHRYAHHPLCVEYEGEVFRLGRRARICRGCALMALGVGAGLAAALGLPRLSLSATGLGLEGLALLISVLFWPRPLDRSQALEGTPEAQSLTSHHRIPTRPLKLATRFVPGFLFSFSVAQGLFTGGAVGWSLASTAMACLTLAVLAYRRRGPSREPCRTCPERFQLHRCRGVQEILRRERAFQRLAGRLLHPSHDRNPA